MWAIARRKVISNDTVNISRPNLAIFLDLCVLSKRALKSIYIRAFIDLLLSIYVVSCLVPLI